MCLRGQANKVVAKNMTNQLDPQIRQIGLRKRVYYYNRFEPKHKGEMDKKKVIKNNAKSEAKKIKKAKIAAPSA